MKKIIASDYDGTFRAEGKYVQNKAAAEKWRKAGNIFGIVTGRNRQSILAALEETPVELDFLICNNGAAAWVGEKRAFCRSFDASVLLPLMRLTRKDGMRAIVVSTPRHEIFVGSEELNRAEKSGRLDFEQDSLPAGVPSRIRKLKRIVQYTAIFDSVPDCVNGSRSVEKNFGESISAYPSDCVVDCVHAEVSKAIGIKAVADYCGIPAERCYAVGDNYNDIRMLDAYYGFAVESANEEVKTHAKQVVSSVAEMIEILLRDNK